MVLASRSPAVIGYDLPDIADPAPLVVLPMRRAVSHYLIETVLSSNEPQPRPCGLALLAEAGLVGTTD
jgi:hypothetical protein